MPLRQALRLSSGIRPAALVLGVVLATGLAGGIPVALAQEEEGGLRLRLTLSPSVVWRDNPDLVADPGPAEAALRAGIDLGFSSVTRTQALRFSASGAFDTDEEVGRDGISDPLLRLSYALTGANARFDAFATYRESDLDDRNFSLDLDGDGIDDDDPVITFSGGFREDLRYGFGFETGLEAPFGFRIDASRRERSYADTTDPELTDSEETEVSALVRFRIDPRITLRITASQTVFEDQDADETRRTTTKAGVGGSFALSPVLTLEADITQDRVETERLSGDSLREGTGFDFALVRDMPNGTLSAEVSRDIDQNGNRDDLRVTREMTLANDAALSFAVGLGRSEDLDFRALAQLSYDQPLKNGRIGARLSQEVRSTDDDEAIVDTRFSANWSRELTPTTALALNVGLTNLEALDPAGQDRRRTSVGLDLVRQLSPRDSLRAGFDISELEISGPGGSSSEERVDIDMSYSRLLVEDWSLVASYAYSARTDTGAAGRYGNTVSLGLQKTFDIRP